MVKDCVVSHKPSNRCLKKGSLLCGMRKWRQSMHTNFLRFLGDKQGRYNITAKGECGASEGFCFYFKMGEI